MMKKLSIVAIVSVSLCGLGFSPAQESTVKYSGLLRVNLDPSEPSWRTDPAWYGGKAEWALYDATRVVYGKPRHYEASIFTNKQQMDPQSTTKAMDWRAENTVEVFKHNVSEIIPTENYDYRFLTTSFIRTNTLEPFKIVSSTQEDCGTTYRQFLFEGGDGGQVDALSLCYFPGAGEKRDSYNMPGQSNHFRFHDDLTLTLRDFPFESPDRSDHMMKLIPDQTDTRESPTRFAEARVELLGNETVSVPFGDIETYHLRVEHDERGGVTESHYWFAADETTLRHVLVQYKGPWGVEYRLKDLAWWAYWDRQSEKTRISMTASK